MVRGYLFWKSICGHAESTDVFETLALVMHLMLGTYNNIDVIDMVSGKKLYIMSDLTVIFDRYIFKNVYYIINT